MALNWLYGVYVSELRLRKPTVAQHTAHDIIVCAAIDLHGRLASASDARQGTGRARFERDPDSERLALAADRAAVPDCAATCNPAEIVPGPLASIILESINMFPCPPDGLDAFYGFSSGNRSAHGAAVAGRPFATHE